MGTSVLKKDEAGDWASVCPMCHQPVGKQAEMDRFAQLQQEIVSLRDLVKELTQALDTRDSQYADLAQRLVKLEVK